MDIAIVTGASSSLGLAISRRLIQLGFRVYGLGGDYKDCPLQNVGFKPVSCDLADPEDLQRACLKILEKEKGIYLLVNNAKFFGNTAFEQMGLREMERILRINLLCPLVLMRVFGKSLCSLQGYVIQLGAPFSESSRGGPAGAASAGGLKWMGEQLFNEHRVRGLKVCYLSPEPNRTQDARKRIRPGARPEASIDPEAVAQAVEQILQSPYGNVVTEMILRPLRIDEPELDPVWKIPYPDPQPIPYTVPREMIEAEEQLEEEDWKKKVQDRKRRRRATTKKTASQPDADKRDDASKAAEPQKEPGQPAEKASGDNKPRKRSRRKPKPSRQVVGFHDNAGGQKSENAQQSGGGNPENKSDAPNNPETKKPARKNTKKSVADESAKKQGKKAVKRSASKQAKKKSAAKKAVKKEAKKTVRKRAPKKASKAPGKDKNND